MVIGYFHVKSVTLPPSKTNPPLIVDPNTVLSFPVSFESLQTVAWKSCEVLQRQSARQKQKFSSRLTLYRLESAHRRVAK
jgi:hypothetical protein